MDGSSNAALQPGYLEKRGPSPESSGVSPPESTSREMAMNPNTSGFVTHSGPSIHSGPATQSGPAIQIQQPTPLPGSPTDSIYSNTNSLAASAAPTTIIAPMIAPAVLARSREPSLRPPPASRDASRASSTTDPFYTPLEQPSISHLNQAELDNLRSQQTRTYSAASTPSSSEFEGEEREDSDTLSPLENVRGPDRRNSRNLLQPTSGEADSFEFDRDEYAQGPETGQMPGNTPSFFPFSGAYHYGNGRESFRREEMP